MQWPGMWQGRFSLVPRILAVNVFALFVLAGGVLYLDSFRARLIDQRREEMQLQANLIAGFLSEADSARLPELAARYGALNSAHLKVYDSFGVLVADSWAHRVPTFTLRDPASEPFRRDIARFLDKLIEGIAGVPRRFPTMPCPPSTIAPPGPKSSATHVRRGAARRAAPRTYDRTVVISAAAPVRSPSSAPAPYAVVQLTAETGDITDVVREERLTSFLIFLGVLAVSLARLSNFLANTIVRPLRRLAVAAQRVRLGRSRDVTVPRFVARRDEIKLLARAVSDMTLALRRPYRRDRGVSPPMSRTRSRTRSRTVAQRGGPRSKQCAPRRCANSCWRSSATMSRGSTG